MPLAAALQNSHQDGGRVFLIFVSDPRTARFATLIGSVQPVDDWVIEYVVKRLARKDVVLPVLPSTDWSTTGGRFRSRCACEA